MVLDHPTADLGPFVAVWWAAHAKRGSRRAYFTVETENEVEPPLPGGFDREKLYCRRSLGPIQSVSCPLPIRLAHDEWQQHLALSMATTDDDSPGSAEYLAWYVAGQRRRVEQRTARVWGAFDGGRLVGHVALHERDGEARFQMVATHADYRRRGICSSLMARAVASFRTRCPTGAAYIVAKAGSGPDRLYEDLGFSRISTLWETSAPTETLLSR